VPAPQATSDLYRTMQRYELLLVTAGRRLWKRMAPDALDASWQQIAPQMVAFTAGGQLAGAQAGLSYVPAVLEEMGTPVKPLVDVRPQAFSGVASDGRSLAGLLEGAVVDTKRAITRGLDGGEALLNGQRWLEQALQSAVADAVRDATAASIVARPGVGWVRMVNPPCCSRCAVLAGKVYKWNSGFARHPRCDCLHIPTTVANADSYLTDPTELAKRGLITDLSQGQKDRLAGGADLTKVLNESRDAWRARMAADYRAEKARKAAEKAGKATGWNGGGSNPPPVGTTIHDLMARLTDRVQAADAMKAAGIAD
jgi:hypothetical protein